jgi:hypothetical protein
MALRTVLTILAAAGGVTANEIASNAVTSAKIDDGAIEAADLGTGSVTAAKVDLSDDFNFTGNLQLDGTTVATGTGSLYYVVVAAVQATNVTLSGGAPGSVQGYSVSLNDDILVIGQSTAHQNGIYNVDSVGTGSNGTWTRPGDRDAANEYPVGMLVYDKNSQKLYKLTTFAGTLGTDAMTFEEHEEGMSIGGGEPIALGTGDGSTLTFDMAVVATIVGAAVFVDGILQDPAVWSISNGGGAGGVDRLAFSSGNAPANGAKVEILAFTRA